MAEGIFHLSYGRKVPFCAAFHCEKRMGFVTFMIVFTVGGSLLVMLLMLAHGSAVEEKLDKQLKAIPDFTPTVSYKSSVCKNAIAIDTQRELIAVLLNPLKIRSLEAKPSVYPFGDLLAVEVVRNDTSVVKTNRGSQAAGAAVGGVLLGPAGLLLGGLSASKRQEEKIQKLSVKLYTNDLVNPVQEVLFWDGGSVGVDPSQLQPILSDLDQWYGRLRVIIERQKRAA